MVDSSEYKGFFARRRFLAILAVLALGCASYDFFRLQQGLLHTEPPANTSSDFPGDYQIGPGDVLELRFSDKPQWDGTYPVLPHGCIVLTEVGAVYVAGLTTEQVAERLRDQCGEEVGLIFADVARYQNQQIYLIGEIAGGNRAIAYQGPETIVQVLRRAGGLTPDADPTAIQIHRAFGSRGEEEVVLVNLVAVLLGQERQHNVYVQPYDRIVVPRNAWAQLRQCLPGWWSELVLNRPSFHEAKGVNSNP